MEVALNDEASGLRRRQVAWTLLFLFAIAVALIGVAYAMLLDDLIACPTPGADSNWGHLSWSVLPPGPRCTWSEELNGIDRVEGPGPGMSIWIAALVGLAFVLSRGYRRTFPRTADRA